MKKLLQGLLEFQGRLTPADRERFAKLALGQAPDSMMIACSDSRVAPNVFASTDPGDLFVVRNVGNLVPPCDERIGGMGAYGTGAALEFALSELRVSHLVVCGHSECGAMQAAVAEKKTPKAPHLQGWLSHVKPALEKWKAGHSLAGEGAPHNRLSQLNVLQQLEHLRSYALVKELESRGKLRLHGWWFDIAQCRVFVLDEKMRRADPIDEEQAKRILGAPEIR